MDRVGNSKAENVALNLLRIVSGFLFFAHGAQKLLGWFGGFGEASTVASWLAWPMGWAGMLEMFGGILLVVGLFSRPVAFVLAGEMAVAYFMAHFPRAFWPIENGGEKAVLFAFVFLYLAARGGGKLSLDRFLEERKAADTVSGDTVSGSASSGGAPPA